MDALLVEKGLITRLGEQLQKAQNSVTERASRLVYNAMGFIGVPYRFGGNSAETGFDCSGFVRAVFAESLGKMLPRRAAQQAAATQVIDRSELRPGDLVFFNTLRRTFSHVGIYIGDNKFIHSPRAGASIRIENMDVRYWNTRFDGARRVALLEHPQQTAAAALTY
ncbi:C40 family peptidase [Hydrogenophaga sp.]|uniref:C40 family peptidase n=1 Tax=Hydrogenophaga sp. TaxID=1904254 RepID=UPI00199B4650|nr:C40 family peptidase [Hydrogenophaga sp.]MBD3893196.1 peptidoglycan endopeptidase [Hydrogenophaga sp.]